MTLTANPPRNEYTATASQSVFNYTFKIYTSQDLDVYITPIGQTADDSTDITTAYTIDPSTIGDEGGGFLTMDSGVTAGYFVTIVSSISEDRTTDYQVNGDFNAPVVNDDFDRSVSLVKQSIDRAGRGLSFQESAQNVTAIGIDEPEAGAFLAWDDTGTTVINASGSTIPGLDTAVAEAEAAADASQVSADDAATSAGNAATSETNAAISAATIPDPAGNAGKFIKVNAGATGYEITDDPSADEERICTAWVNFDGFTANTRDEFNIASITDNGPGDYEANFTAALSNVNYCPVVSSASGEARVTGVKTVNGFGVKTADSAGVNIDVSQINAVVFGGQ